MNVEAVRWAFGQEAGGPREKLVLCTIAAAAGEDRRCRVAIGKLAHRCEMSVPQILRALHRLEDAKLLNKAPGPNGAAHIYRFVLRGLEP